eukprot:4454934-Prymnesium_polylepis.1
MEERAGRRAGVRVRRRVGIRLTHTPIGLSRGWVWWPGHGHMAGRGWALGKALCTVINYARARSRKPYH